MRERGLTLVEILVAMGIAGVVGALIMVIVINNTGMFTDQSGKVQRGLDINDALSQVRLSIKDANGVVSSYTDGGITYTTGADQLILKVASVDASGDIIDGIFDYFVFFKDQDLLRLKTFPNASSSRKQADRVLSTSVADLNFHYFNSASPPVEVVPNTAAKVRVSLKLNQTNTATSEANLRND